MGRKLIRTVLVMGWIPTLALMMGAKWMTGTLAFAQGPTPVKVTRLYTGPDGKTKVEEYEIPLKPQGKGTELSQTVAVKSVQFRWPTGPWRRADRGMLFRGARSRSLSMSREVAKPKVVHDPARYAS
jgi:hypothetical protein